MGRSGASILHCGVAWGGQAPLYYTAVWRGDVRRLYITLRSDVGRSGASILHCGLAWGGQAPLYYTAVWRGEVRHLYIILCRLNYTRVSTQLHASVDSTTLEWLDKSNLNIRPVTMTMTMAMTMTMTMTTTMAVTMMMAMTMTIAYERRSQLLQRNFKMESAVMFVLHLVIMSHNGISICLCYI